MLSVQFVTIGSKGDFNSFIQDLDHDDVELEVDYSLFDECIWPNLAQRVPAFESLKVRILFCARKK